MGNNRIALDKLGREIHVGSYIAYGHALGRCAGLRIGKVLNIRWQPRDNWRNDQPDEARFTVRGIDDDWSHKQPMLASRKGTLMFANRILVVDEATLSSQYRELLKGV